jgi:carboxyl-terminal processing protease
MLNEVESLKKQNVDAIVVDLRSNGGGSLDESIDIAGLFFDKGPVVQIKDMRGSVYVQKDEDVRTLYGGPLVVLINRQSASASEIFAGAIQDYKRGLIVGGQHTFGKGTVQNLNDIDEKLGAVKVTISKFFRPSGASTQLKGVESDVVLPDLFDEYEIGEKHYDYALPWEKIPPSDFKATSFVTPEVVKTIADASKTRVGADKGFEKVRAAIKEYRDGEEGRSKVSLKEDAPENKKEAKDVVTSGKATKGHEKDKKKTLDDAEGDEKLPLTEDFQLQETLRIAADYIEVLNKRPLGKISLPDLDKMNVAAQQGTQPAGATKPEKPKK